MPLKEIKSTVKENPTQRLARLSIHLYESTRKHGTLNRDDELFLFEIMTWGDDWKETARNIVASTLRRRVISVARTFTDDPDELEELCLEGNIALAQALDKFKPSKGNRFNTYVTRVVHNAMYNFVPKNRSLPITSHIWTEYLNFKKKFTELEEKGELISYDVTWLSKALDISEEKILVFLFIEEYPLRLDSEVRSEEGGIPLGDLIAGPIVSLEDDMIKCSKTNTVQALLSKLNLQERTVIELVYGLNENEALSNREICRKLKLRRKTVLQIQETAFQKLRKSAHKIEEFADLI